MTNDQADELKRIYERNVMVMESAILQLESLTTPRGEPIPVSDSLESLEYALDMVREHFKRRPKIWIVMEKSK
jgi:hypothetical protein